MMLLKQEQLNPCEVELEIEVSKDNVSKAVDEAYKEFSAVMNIPGFRKGKAPKAILQKYVKEEKLKDRVEDKVIQPAYLEALEETKLEPWGPADVDIINFDINDKLQFKAKVPLAPVVELGDYVGLDVERRQKIIKDEDIDAEIQEFLERSAEYIPVKDRKVENGDYVLVEVLNTDKPDEEPKRNVIKVGESIKDFDNGIVGMSVDEEKVIKVVYPEDYAAEELRGQEVQLKTKIIEINEKHVPELNDEWVKKTFVGDTKTDDMSEEDIVDTVDKLKAKIRNALEKNASDAADSQLRSDLVDTIVKNSKVNFPGVMVRAGVNDRIKGLLDALEQRQLTIDDYLKHIDKTAEDLRGQFEKETSEALTTMLVLNKIKKKEGIKVEEDDIKAEISQIAAERGVPEATINAYLEKTNGLDDLKDRIRRKKVVDFLVNASNIKNVG